MSDLDGTLLGEEEALDRFAQWYQARQGDLRLVYATGRFFDSVVGLVASTSLPEPAAVIGGVGTEICLYPGGEHVDGWPRLIGGWDPAAVRALLAAYKELQPQPAEFQTGFKLSYYGHGLSCHFLVEVRRELAMAGHCVEIVYSSHRDLDVLPAGVNKGSAAAFLAARWGWEPWRVMVCGDTGNDVSMFMGGFRGITVGNAHPELKSIRSPDVYHSPHAYAAGVLDGVTYWLGRSPDAGS